MVLRDKLPPSWQSARRKLQWPVSVCLTFGLWALHYASGLDLQGSPSLSPPLPLAIESTALKHVVRRQISKESRTNPLSFSQCCFLLLSCCHPKLAQVPFPNCVERALSVTLLNFISQPIWIVSEFCTGGTKADTGPLKAEGGLGMSRLHLWMTSMSCSDLLVLPHASELLTAEQD